MATRLCARTAVRALSTGEGSDPHKLLARRTVDGEEGLRERRRGMGAVPFRAPS